MKKNEIVEKKNDLIKTIDKEIKNNDKKLKNFLIDTFNFIPSIQSECKKLLSDPETRYYVEFIKKPLEGQKLMESKDGILKAVMLRPDGKTYEIPNLYKEQLPKNIDLSNVALQVAMQEIKQQIKEVLEKLETINDNILSVKEEILRTRDSKCNSAINNYIKYVNATGELKNAYLNACTQDVGNGFSELKDEAISLINKINEKYDKDKVQWKIEKVEEFNEIQSNVDRLKIVLKELHKLVLVECLVANINENYSVLDITLEEYKKFIKTTFDEETLRMLYHGDNEIILYGNWKNLTLKSSKKIVKMIEEEKTKELIKIEVKG